MSRIVPLTGLEIERELFELFGLVFPNEVHTTEDQKRIFIENVVAGSVFLGDVASESEMLLLSGSHSRGCFAGDICIRTDEDAVWICKSGKGESLSDWQRLCYRFDPLTSGHWEPVTNGDSDSPEIVFSDGDVVMTFVEN